VRDCGSATVEFAMVLPAIALLLGVIGVAAQAGVAAVRAQEAASVGARVAITNSDENARDAAVSIAGPDSTATVVRDGPWIRVTVSVPGPWGLDARANAVTRDQG
jgi:Flp pilus assembly protein TadG